MLKLNLGCGRVTFPMARDAELSADWAHHLQALPETCFEPGWVNVDKFAGPGVDEVIDLFRFPWLRSSNGNPFNNDSVDEIWASHIVEHVPHQVLLARGLPPLLERDYLKWVSQLDGFFVFFAECWRILKPNGLIHVRCPYAFSLAAVADPTHTRYITPGSFSYLAAEGREHAPFDYHLPLDFQMEGEYALRFSGPWVERANKHTAKGNEELLNTYLNVCDELTITLRAVKRE